MKTYSKSSISLSSFIFILFYTLMLLGTFNSTFSSLSRLGILSLLTVLTISNLLFLWHLSTSKEINKRLLTLIIVSITFVIINLLGLFNNMNNRSFITLFQFVSLIGFMVFISTIKINSFRINIIRKLSILFIAINFIIWTSQGFTTYFFKSIYPNPNLLGTFLFINMFFILLDRKKKISNITFILISLFMIYASSTRSAFLALSICFLAYLLWPFITKNKKRFISFFTAFLATLLSFIFIYPKLISWQHFYSLNDFVYRYTGKNIYSGREVIWSNLIEIINQKPLLGYGTGVLPGNVISSGLSAHNFYLQIALQNGYIGLFILLLLFMLIWNTFWNNRSDYIVRLSASFFIGILIYQTFEVSLTQNQIASGIIMWFIIAIGISQSINQKDEMI